MTTTVILPILRPATAADAGLLRALFVAGLPAGLAALSAVPGLLEQQHAARETSHAASFDSLRDAIVEVDGEPVGRLLTTSTPQGTLVVDISIGPRQRGHGLGTALLRGLLDAGPVSLTVAIGNPARRLYERLGFTAVAANETDLSLHHPGHGHPTSEGIGA